VDEFLPKRGMRVKGAWGLGTCTSDARTVRKNKYYGNGVEVVTLVDVRWDKTGHISTQQRADALEPAINDTIVYAECPNCEIEEMIFYYEDYICAWCREKLEDV
jgi:hypothetical protein